MLLLLKATLFSPHIILFIAMAYFGNISCNMVPKQNTQHT